jgi:hypothetical protein
MGFLLIGLRRGLGGVDKPSSMLLALMLFRKASSPASQLSRLLG